MSQKDFELDEGRHGDHEGENDNDDGSNDEHEEDDGPDSPFRFQLSGSSSLGCSRSRRRGSEKCM